MLRSKIQKKKKTKLFMQIRDQKAISIFISTSVIDYDKQLIYTHIYIYLTSDLTAALLEYWTVYRTVSKVTKSTSFILLCRRSILLSKKTRHSIGREDERRWYRVSSLLIDPFPFFPQFQFIRNLCYSRIRR